MRRTRWLVTSVLSVLVFVVSAWAETPWESYLAHPVPENADRVAEISYTEGKYDLTRIDQDLMLLEVQMVAADSSAVDLAFRLKADGYVGQTVSEMLGSLIRVNPRLFLQVLQRNRSTVVRLDSLVGGFGPAYVDRERAQNYERDQRLAALLSVNDPALVKVRDECVAILREK